MKKSLSSRRFVIIAIFVGICVIFIGRLFYIQVIDESYKSSADNNVLRYITEYPARGLIYDSKGRLLVFNEATYDLMVIPHQMPKTFDTAEFCKIVGVDKAIFIKKVKAARVYSSYLPSIFEEKIGVDRYGLIQEQLIDYPGFYVQARTIRNYPHSIAAHILGYIGETTSEKLKEDDYYSPGDYVGVSGIEKSYETDLRGRKGIKIIMVDVHNRDKGSYMSGKFDREARAGFDLYTSLDIDLQTYGELLMKNKRGAIVAIEPSSGGILAMVSSPNYDPSLLVGRNRAKNYYQLIQDKSLPLFNRALTGRYPPGSAFKTAIGLVALQEGVISTSSTYFCGGAFPLGNDKSVGCHGHPSPLAIEAAIQYSCNSFFCRAFKAILDNKKYPNIRAALQAWRKHMLSFGFGEKTGTDLPNESTGNIPTDEYYDRMFGVGKWRSMSFISVSIGQGEIQLTPLQMANLVAIIANRGWYYPPHIVKAVGSKDKPNSRYIKKKYTSVASEYFDPIIEGMYSVVEAGTARDVKMDSIKVCGKTGTVQNSGKNHSIFIAFAPMDNPKIAIAVVVENSGAGATWGAPIASLMIERYIRGKVKRTDLEYDMINSGITYP